MSDPHELSVDPAAFLPDGVTFGEEPAPSPPSSVPAPSPAGPDLGALEQIVVDLSAVDAALAALDAGTYGRCATCQEPIEDELLAGDPTTVSCALHR